MTHEFSLQPVLALLAQTDSAYDVPAGPEMFVGGWLAPVAGSVLSLAADVDPAAAAARSRSDRGVLELFLEASDDGRALFARVQDPDSAVAVHRPGDKSVTLTLAGTAGFEAYRHADDVADDQPWYVREFDQESIYACHPDTLHRLDLSPDAVQLVVRDTAELPGRPVDADTYEEALAAACGRLRELAPSSPGASLADGQQG